MSVIQTPRDFPVEVQLRILKFCRGIDKLAYVHTFYPQHMMTSVACCLNSRDVQEKVDEVLFGGVIFFNCDGYVNVVPICYSLLAPPNQKYPKCTVSAFGNGLYRIQRTSTQIWLLEYLAARKVHHLARDIVKMISSEKLVYYSDLARMYGINKNLPWDPQS